MNLTCNELLDTAGFPDLQSAMNPSFVCDTLQEFMDKIKAAREAHDALNEAEAKMLVSDLIQSLMEIAYQVLRTMPWTKWASKAMVELRKEINTFDNIGYFYEFQMSLFQDALEPLPAAKSNQNKENPNCFRSLFAKHPGMYDVYISTLNDLITLQCKFNCASDITIPRLAITIGRQACALASTMFHMLENDDYARRMRIISFSFTPHLLLKPILLDSRLVCNTDHGGCDRAWVLEVMKNFRDCTEEDMERIKHYHIVSMINPFDPELKSAFAILSHDITKPFCSLEPSAHDYTWCSVVHICHMEVAPSFRRLGIGSFLLDTVRRTAEDNGFEALVIGETPLMLETEAFWTARGFKASDIQSGWREKPLQSSVGCQ